MYKKLNNSIIKYFLFIFFISFVVVGYFIFKDYSIYIDDPFHRTAGYFWLIYILDTFSLNFEILQNLKSQIKDMEYYYDLVDGRLLYYGAIFDTLIAFFNNNFDYLNLGNPFHVKHFTNYIIFIISGIFYYNIILDRFKNKNLALLSSFIYFTSPRIFAESFYNSKDILFMSLTVMVIYYMIKLFQNFNFKNILLLSLLLAIAIQVRILGIYLLVLFLSFLFFSYLEKDFKIGNNLFKLFSFLIICPFLTVFFWPYLWSDPISNFIQIFITFSKYHWAGEVLYLGSYVSGQSLPWHYIPVWVLITTPPLFLILFLHGFIKVLQKLGENILNLESTNKFWNSQEEKKDFFFLFFLITPIFMIILLNSTLYGGWRHLYFIYPGLVYFMIFSAEIIFKMFKNKIYKTFVFTIFIVALITNIVNLIKLHPYQNIYFNFLVEKRANELFEIDYWGLGNAESLRQIIFDADKNKLNKVQVRTASFTPLNYTKLIMSESENERLILTGTKHLNQDYIFTNRVYERNPKFLKKYRIPDNYKKIFVLRRGNVVINEIYKKN